MPSIRISCVACGAANFKNPEKPGGSSVVTCGSCGCELGTVSEIQAAGNAARSHLGKNPTTDQLRAALRNAFSALKTIKVE